MTTRAKQGGAYQDWGQLRDHLIERYANTPHPSTEQEIIDAYELHPDAVTKAALEIIDQTGVTSPWGLLKSRATRIAAPPANPTRSSSLEREKRIERAEQFIQTTGVHLDRTDEVLDELFSEAGLLHDYAQVYLERRPDGWHLTEPTGDTDLVTRMLDLWAEHRHKGLEIERDAEARAEKWKQQHADQKAHPHADIEDRPAAEPAPLPDADYSATEDEPIPF